MFNISNGLLIKDGKKVIALGSHYYPSFHPLKVPVIDSKKRLQEAITDIKSIKELGFDLVRIANIGQEQIINNKIEKDFTFVDSLIELISKNKMATLVRIQGYSSNLRNVQDALMKNQNGEERSALSGIYSDSERGIDSGYGMYGADCTCICCGDCKRYS